MQCIGIRKGKFEGVVYKYGKVSLGEETKDGNLPFRFEYDILDNNMIPREEFDDDNFFKLLEVEPIALNGERIDQTTIVPGFGRAEEKAVKAIQKHSMNIDGFQRNNKIDEAYLLLGKARYYDRRFFPAMEAFNYLLENYADSKTYVEGRIWREKTNIRLRNNELAIKNDNKQMKGALRHSYHRYCQCPITTERCAKLLCVCVCTKPIQCANNFEVYVRPEAKKPTREIASKTLLFTWAQNWCE